jgi:hypothetical protein
MYADEKIDYVALNWCALEVLLDSERSLDKRKTNCLTGGGVKPEFDRFAYL